MVESKKTEVDQNTLYNDAYLEVREKARGFADEYSEDGDWNRFKLNVQEIVKGFPKNYPIIPLEVSLMVTDRLAEIKEGGNTSIIRNAKKEGITPEGYVRGDRLEAYSCFDQIINSSKK